MGKLEWTWRCACFCSEIRSESSECTWNAQKVSLRLSMAWACPRRTSASTTALLFFFLLHETYRQSPSFSIVQLPRLTNTSTFYTPAQSCTPRAPNFNKNADTNVRPGLHVSPLSLRFLLCCPLTESRGPLSAPNKLLCASVN